MEKIKQKSMAGLFPSIDSIPDSIRIREPLFQKQILIDGALRDWNGPVHLVRSPVHIRHDDGTTEPLLIGSYPLATTVEGLQALAAAKAAFNYGRGEWPAMSVQDRIGNLEIFVEKMVGLREEIVRLIVWEIGKSIADAEKEFDRTVEYITQTITAAGRLNNQHMKVHMTDNFIGHTRKVPYGVVLCMGPFNYPLNETFTTLIPALIMGNTILFKPPKYGTLLFAPLLSAFSESFPRGVVNTVYGRGKDVVPALMSTGDIDVLALIGTSSVANSLKRLHPKPNRLKAVLGLDAKNSAIVLPDADLPVAVKECVAGALGFNGQRCTALKLLFVHERIVEEFNLLLVEEVNRQVIGMPWTKGVSITPLADPDKPAYLSSLIADALDKGAEVINLETGDDRAAGSLLRPVILYPVNDRMAVYHEEQFGPVIPIVPFTDIATPIESITQSRFGQQVSLFSQDKELIGELIDMLSMQVGRININTQSQRSPDNFVFGGRKDSAEGSLSVDEALLTFSTHSVVAARQDDTNKKIFEDILMDNQSSRLSNNCVSCG